MSDRLKGSDVKSSITSTGLYSCIKSRDIITAQTCIKQGESVHTRCEITDGSFLHLLMDIARPMTDAEYVSFVYLFSNAGISLDHKDSNGKRAIQLAIEGSLLQLMIALLKCGANADPKDEDLISKYGGYFQSEYYSYFRKFSPGLWQAVTENNVFRVNKLVKSWCRVNISRNNKSLIEFAKENEADDRIVDLLVKYEASIEFAHATIAGDLDRMQLLLCNGSVDMSIHDLSHRKDVLGEYKPLSLEDAARLHKQNHVFHIFTGNIGTSGSAKVTRNAKSAVCTVA